MILKVGKVLFINHSEIIIQQSNKKQKKNDSISVAIHLKVNSILFCFVFIYEFTGEQGGQWQEEKRTNMNGINKNSNGFEGI